MIPYGRQHIDEHDIAAVVEVLRSDWLTQGPCIERFEAALTDVTGANHAVAVSNATAALHLACMALDVGPGDLVWTSPNTFVASANCARYCGATVDFVDIEADTGNMDAQLLAQKLADAARHGRLPKVVIPVHFAGQSCDMAAIGELASVYGFKVIEDASHAVGGRYRQDAVGCGRFSDITVFSFHPVKIVTTGEGGAALCKDPQLAARMRRLRSHGISRDPALMQGEYAGGWYYEQLELGFNYRMTDMQAALGVSQLGRLGHFILRRRELAARYRVQLSGRGLSLPEERVDRQSAWHLYPVRLQEAARRRQVYDLLRTANVGVNVHYIPVHLQPYYRQLGFRPGDFPVAEGYYQSAISLPLFPGLTDKDQDWVIEALTSILR
ncbi:UDP-4-amino-4,6-dideoxy-N-acetyl-beta-L-altrosamine transaminase [Parachitinimonas caeni]|uniref:UDP-4-amino-4, 6-dideoxy-N-acetyl-beta-L-altrosamine transaminase n=1 Tax=Parachitinimonas caeni TaxID=3031301 RepID=A0ABT7E0N7_9NEIS|nr:UDP-4-amino-4,6-dideoxy-N-acetyl-beta-L-altrosamine transaminase [Parachitinimonas caeni]MDK2125872.1 UDP-4-amino-4,6-dideoxy-N-acetyl-beta-L-altrosamine transaminase [Parachitinimonas caeni]